MVISLHRILAIVILESIVLQKVYNKKIDTVLLHKGMDV